MSGNGGGACELCVGVHTSHCIGHTVGSGTGRHIVGMEGTSCTAAGSYREVLLALLNALLLVGACNRMLETGRIGGVSCDGNVNALVMHYSNALANVVRAVAANLCALAVRISDFLNNFKLACIIVKLGLNIGKAVDTGNNLSGVLSETVKDNA